MKTHFLSRLITAVITGTLIFTAGTVTSFAEPSSDTSDVSATSGPAITAAPDKYAPSPVKSSSVNFTDKFTSNTKNHLTITWKKAKKANGYKIIAVITGTTDKQSVISKVDSSESQTVYTGKKNTAVININRNTMYRFSIISYSKRNGTKHFAKSADINYYPATDDDTGYASIMKKYLDNSSNNALKIHGNVITVLKDYKTSSKTVGYKNDWSMHNDYIKKYGKNSKTVIIDFAGHIINTDNKKTPNVIDASYGSIIFQDSVGGGGLKDTKGHPDKYNRPEVSIYGSVIINSGTFVIGNGATYKDYYDPVIIVENYYKPGIIINGGIIKGTVSLVSTVSTTINDGAFDEVWFYSSGERIINGGTFGNIAFNGSGKHIINGGTFKTLPKKIKEEYAGRIIKNSDGTYTVKTN